MIRRSPVCFKSGCKDLRVLIWIPLVLSDDEVSLLLTLTQLFVDLRVAFVRYAGVEPYVRMHESEKILLVVAIVFNVDLGI